MIDLRYLRSFAEVAAHGHVGRAAAKLKIAQPSLSYQIARLEESLGATLFERTPRGMSLTPAGQALLEESTSILQRIDGLRARVQDVAQGRTGTLTIGLVAGVLLSGVASRIIRAYRARYPRVTVKVRVVVHVPLIRMLRERQVDLAVFGTSLGDTQLIGEPLAHETLVVALPAEHKLASRKLVHYRDLNGSVLVALSREVAPALFTGIFGLCTQHGYVPTAIEEAVSEDAVIGLVAAGVGVAVVPDSWSRIAIPGVVIRKLRPASQGQTLRLFRRADDESPLVREFVASALSTR